MNNQVEIKKKEENCLDVKTRLCCRNENQSIAHCTRSVFKQISYKQQRKSCLSQTYMLMC